MSKQDKVDKILSTVSELKPESVNKLINSLVETSPYNEKEILDTIIFLENNDKINLTSPQKSNTKTIGEYAFSLDAAWLWITIGISVLTSFTLLIFRQSVISMYIRYVFGSIFIMFLPGYTLIKSLFPAKEINYLERIILSIGSSISLTPLIGLLLNYTPWGITVWTLTPSLFILILILSILGLFREYNSKNIQ